MFFLWNYFEKASVKSCNNSMTPIREEFCTHHNYDLKVHSFSPLDLILLKMFNYTIPKKGYRIQQWTHFFKTIKIHKIIALLRYLICNMFIACSIMCIKFTLIGQL